MNTPSVLVLLAHPDFKHSRINRALRDELQAMPGVNVHDLYAAYPDFHIDVKKEQALLTAADVIVFQFPFYWYSCPALLKDWEDKVLTRGFAHGPGGNALTGKTFFIVISTGAPLDAYRKEGRNHFEISQLLSPFEQMANLCGMRYVLPFVVAGVNAMSDDELAHARQELRARIHDALQGQKSI